MIGEKDLELAEEYKKALIEIKELKDEINQMTIPYKEIEEAEEYLGTLKEIEKMNGRF